MITTGPAILEPVSYTLQVIGANIDPSGFNLKRPPNPYLEAILPKTSYRTSEAKNTYKPVWDRCFHLASYSPETSIVLRVQQLARSRSSSKVIGETHLSLETLLAICRHDGSACLEICSPHRNGERVGTVALQLEECINHRSDVPSLREDLTSLQLELKDGIGIVRVGGSPNMTLQQGPLTPANRILARMNYLGTMITHLSRAHPLLDLACEAITGLHKTLQSRVDLHQSLLDLFAQMDQTLSFVEDVNVTPDKLKRFEDTIIEVLRVIRECCQFLEEYIRQSSKRRILWQAVTGEPDRFVQFRKSLSQLHSQLSGNVLSQILVTVNKIQTKPKDTTPSRTNDNIPRPTAAFTGRADILNELSNYFGTATASVRCRSQRIFVLWGLGGSGKTQIALKFANIQYAKFSAIYMVDASSIESIRLSLINIGRSVRLEDPTPEKTLEWFCQQAVEWLLIFDNADDPHIDLRLFFPRCSYGNIIITSRNRECRIHAIGANTYVSAIPDDDAVQLLLKVAGKSATEANTTLASNIVRELGHLALAIVQAGSYILSGRCSLAQYPELFRTRHSELLKHMPIQRIDNYQGTVYTTWEMNFSKLTTFTRAFFDVCAFLYRDGISEEVFRRAVLGYSRGTPIELHNPLNPDVRPIDHSAAFLSNLQKDDGEWNSIRFGQVVSELLSYSLIIERTDNFYSIHPLVQSWARDHLPSQQRQDALLRTVCILYHSLCFDERLGPLWLRQIHEKQLYELSQFAHTDMIKAMFARALHTLGFYDHATELAWQVIQFRQVLLGDDHPATLDAMASISITLRELGQWREAQRVGVIVIRLRKKTLGPVHSDTLEAMSEQSLLYSRSGKWPQAEKLAKKVLRYRRQLLGDHHPDTLKAISRLSDAMRMLGRYRVAESLDLQVYEIRYRLHKDDQHHFLDALTSLANTHRGLGRYRQAENLELSVWDGLKQTLGDEHPKTLQSMFRIARIYCDLRVDRKAQNVMVRVLEVQKRVFGDDHPDTLCSLAQMAVIHRNRGEYQEAKQLEGPILNARKWLFGETHPDTLSAMANLAWTHAELGNYQEAKELEEFILDARKQLLGNEHPDTLSAMANLGSTFRNMGKYQEAERLEVLVLSSRQRLLGSEHPDTLSAVANLGWTYDLLGKYQEAKQLREKALEAQKQQLGTEHPDTLCSMGNLACTYINLGEYQEAKRLQSLVYSTQERLLGNDHPDTLSTMVNLASTYRILGNFQKARKLQHSVLATRRRIFGNEHPETLSVMANLASTCRHRGEYQEAQQLEESVLSVRQRLLGNEHPDTLSTLANLASTYRSLGRYREGERLEVSVLSSRQRLLGNEHPDTLSAMANLGWTYDLLGKYQEAKQLREKALEAQERKLGAEHPVTLCSMGNLASTYINLCKYREAERLQSSILSTQKRLLGDEHPDTLSAMANLAWTYHLFGSYRKAEELQSSVLAARRRLLGNDHPDTLRAMANCACTQNKLGNYEAAEELEVLVLHKRKLVLGRDHPHTLLAMENLVWTWNTLGKYQNAKELKVAVSELRGLRPG